MVFTESDAQNDGLIKREVGKEMAKVAKTQNPQMFQYFENVCEEVGRQPSDVLGEMAVKSLNNEGYANQLLNTEINMSNIKADEIRLEDVRYVKKLSEELGLNDNKESKDPIDRLINQRLESVTSSPLENMRGKNRDPEGINGEVVEYMESMEQKITELESKIGESSKGTQQTEESTTSESKSVDELFGGDDDAGETNEEQQTEQVEEVEEGPSDDEEVQVEEDATQEQVEEAFEGTDNDVEGIFDDDAVEGSGVEGDMFTSEDGEEE